MPRIVHPLLKDGVEARAYQIRSLQRALSFSSLMVMPTGFGKTAVEWMAMAAYLHDGASKIVLIAPTTGLVEQQRTMAEEMLAIDPDQIVAYTGETGPGKREALWASARIIMATPQVIRNDAMNGIIDLATVALLIVDEAHHATGNHAYAQVGTLYQRTNPSGRVLAATASPGSNLRSINEVRTNLNAHNLDLSKRSDPLLSPYDVDMNIHTHVLTLPDELLTLIAPLRAHFDAEVKHLQQMGFLPKKEFIGTSDIERAQQSASRAIQQRDVRGYDAARKVADLRRIHILMNLLQTQGTSVAKAFLNRAEEEGRKGRKTNRLLALPVVHQLRLTLNNIDELHPKADLVESLVTAEIQQKPAGKILVFTEFRDSVERLVASLKHLPDIVPDAFIGQSSRGAQKGMTQKEQLAQLNRFRSGEINVLVATSVGEEGLDVPAADLVVLYEPVPSAVRAIQRRGRTARQRAGSVHVLIAKDTRDAYVHRASERQEENMHRLMNRLVRQKQLNEAFDVRDGALDHFSVDVNGQTMSAEAFLSSKTRELAVPTTEPLNSIEEVQPRSNSSNNIAEPLRPDQIRPQAQSSLFSFEETTDKTEFIATEEAMESALRAADDEIVQVSDVDGQARTVYIDHRESRSTLPGYLQGLGFQTVFTHLPVGDVRLSERVLIERKTARDLLDSIKSGRLLRQCRHLKTGSSRTLLLIETGGESQYSVHPNAVLGALAHITLDLGIPVMSVKGPLEAAHFIALAAQRENAALDRLHEFVTKEEKTGSDVRKLVAIAQHELMAIVDEPDERHPWLDTRREHLVRCYDHCVQPLVQNDTAHAQVLQAYSPNLGRLLTATVSDMVEMCGCSQKEAETVYEALRGDFMSR